MSGRPPWVGWCRSCQSRATIARSEGYGSANRIWCECGGELDNRNLWRDHTPGHFLHRTDDDLREERERIDKTGKP